MLLSAGKVGLAILAGAIAYTIVSTTPRAAQGARRGASSGVMPLEEAYLLLGLKAGARRSDVLAIHRNLMKLIHPDRGGTAYLAAKVNEAKDVLLHHIRA